MSETPLTPQQIAAAELKASKNGYIHRVLVGADQFMATILDVKNDQTISSEDAIAAHKKVWYAKIAEALQEGLDEIQKNHDELAQAGDIERAKETIAMDTMALAEGK